MPTNSLASKSTNAKYSTFLIATQSPHETYESTIKESLFIENSLISIIFKLLSSKAINWIINIL